METDFAQLPSQEDQLLVNEPNQNFLARIGHVVGDTLRNGLEAARNNRLSTSIAIGASTLALAGAGAELAVNAEPVGATGHNSSAPGFKQGKIGIGPAVSLGKGNKIGIGPAVPVSR